MKYIASSDRNKPGIWYGRYLAYLKTIKASLPKKVYAFASDEKYFNLDSPHSLHDGHLQSLEIRDERTRSGPSRLNITIRLIGAHRDRVIVLHYCDVESYEIVCKKKRTPLGRLVHRDVFTHELRLGRPGLLIHEILYWPDTTFLVEFKRLKHYEEPYADKEA